MFLLFYWKDEISWKYSMWDILLDVSLSCFGSFVFAVDGHHGESCVDEPCCGYADHFGCLAARAGSPAGPAFGVSVPGFAHGKLRCGKTAELARETAGIPDPHGSWHLLGSCGWAGTCGWGTGQNYSKAPTRLCPPRLLHARPSLGWAAASPCAGQDGAGASVVVEALGITVSHGRHFRQSGGCGRGAWQWRCHHK